MGLYHTYHGTAQAFVIKSNPAKLDSSAFSIGTEEVIAVKVITLLYAPMKQIIIVCPHEYHNQMFDKVDRKPAECATPIPMLN